MWVKLLDNGTILCYTVGRVRYFEKQLLSEGRYSGGLSMRLSIYLHLVEKVSCR